MVFKRIFLLLTLSTLTYSSSVKIQSISELLANRPDVEYIKCHDSQYFHYDSFDIAKFPELEPNEGLFAESYILKIPNGQVGSQIGFIKVDGAIIKDCMSQNWSLSTQMNIVENKPFKNIKHIKGRVAVITMMFDSCYSHWLYNVLGRLALLEMNGIEYDWLFVACDKPFMKKTLQLWGIDTSKIIQPFDDTKYIEADELIVPSHLGTRAPLPNQYYLNWIPLEDYCKHWNVDFSKMSVGGWMKNPKFDTPLPINVSINDCFLTMAPLCSIYFVDWMLEYIRNKFLAHIENNDYKFCKKIFISRADTSIRKMLNEDEIFSIFEKYGYKKYVLGFMPTEEQIALFNQAESIVSAHGTGLINLMFCKPGTKVVEIFQGRSDCSLYYLSQILHLDYKFIQTMDFETIEGQGHTTVPTFLIQDFINEFIK